jgi:hypothetical protein
MASKKSHPADPVQCQDVHVSDIEWKVEREWWDPTYQLSCCKFSPLIYGYNGYPLKLLVQRKPTTSDNSGIGIGTISFQSQTSINFHRLANVLGYGRFEPTPDIVPELEHLEQKLLHSLFNKCESYFPFEEGEAKTYQNFLNRFIQTPPILHYNGDKKSYVRYKVQKDKEQLMMSERELREFDEKHAPVETVVLSPTFTLLDHQQRLYSNIYMTSTKLFLMNDHSKAISKCDKTNFPSS